MKLSDMDIEVATRILVLRCAAAVAEAEAQMLGAAEAFRHDPREETARATIEAHDAWTQARVAHAHAEADQHLSALIEEMEDMVDLDTWTENYLRQVAQERLDMGDRGSTAAHGGELAAPLAVGPVGKGV
ncbi:MAG: hypothetical protein EA397_13625 [Deltaproteobacteria bacterium]|nr:MAG: hypothetical protein EA397_13625 [Deltaproteobacteria bacterium]